MVPLAAPVLSPGPNGSVPWTAVAFALALCALALPRVAPAADPAGGLREARSDSAWLQAVQDAARRQSFSGTVVYQRGDEVHASRVVQLFDGTDSRERVLTLDGQPREFIRQGDEVQCLYPLLRRVVIERGGARSFPSFAEPLSADVLNHYDLRHLGSERVAGRPCDVAELVPRDRLRYGYRLCVEPSTGLLFKAQTLNEKREVLEQISFTDVRLGEPIDPAQLRPSWSSAGWKVDRQASQATELRQQGWSVTAPSGFHRLAEVVRHLMGAGNAEHEALQAVYSDGLATVSVFIEPGAPLMEEPEDAQQRGPLTAVSRTVGDARITVVGEVPRNTAQAIADSVVHSSPPPR